MTIQQAHEKRTAPETGSGINSLIAACNKNDRFKLLEDDSVPLADLDNTIHPIFCSFDCDGPLKQMLQLASQFFIHDSLLDFFVPLLYGRELSGANGVTSKPYLSDPLANVSEAKRKEYISGVREALHCLAHSIDFQFVKSEKRVYARTILSTAKPTHISTCCPAFQRRYTAKIELSDKFKNYYYDADGYAVASRCAQFRHDFLFATTLVHEIVHAVGVMRRGNLNEPCICADYPDTEWGYGWEHFMFGNVINPQDRTRPGTHLMMRKVWADQKVADKAGGKEYCDVPMSYIAQWFRKATWDIVAETGPTAIPLPTSHFKIQSSNKYGAWVVSSDCLDVKQDLVALHNHWKQCAQRSHPDVLRKEGRIPASKIFWRLRTTEQLQKSNVSAPVRIPERKQHHLIDGQPVPLLKSCTAIPEHPHVPTQKELVAACRSSSPSGSGSSRKRQADPQDESSCSRKSVKR